MRNSTCILHPSIATTVALPVIYCFLFITGSFGNILAAWVFSRQASTKRTQHIYLVNLITANLLVCSTMPFVAGYFAKGHQWTYGSDVCRVAYHLGTIVMHVCMYVTITILCTIALSQYATLKKNSDARHSQAVTKNLYKRGLQKFRQPKFAKYFCIFIWLIVLCVTVTAITYDARARRGQTFHTCYNVKVEIGEFTAKTAASFATACFFLFFLTVLLSYYSLTRHLSKIQKNTHIGQNHMVYRTVKRNILVIQIILTACFLPYHIFRPILYVLLPEEDCSKINYLVEIKNFLTCLCVSRSSIDPVTTLLLDKTFKKSLYSLFKKSTPEKHQRRTDIFIEDSPPIRSMMERC
ncbi:probable G-protein coupled receptor 82 [Tympanuchus pallidicinctus]|uniref:probable G-protein coupled receptor 82 n=1 Tax=Tympanuchus pallidicinctus TaxID=109042 RepID=UPI00228769A3|nr:probable G-protein coupled receptor 82 [Tympanuchus pallidicinctus]